MKEDWGNKSPELVVVPDFAVDSAEVSNKKAVVVDFEEIALEIYSINGEFDYINNG